MHLADGWFAIVAQGAGAHVDDLTAENRAGGREDMDGEARRLKHADADHRAADEGGHEAPELQLPAE